MLILESARVKFEADLDETAVEPPSLYVDRDVNQEMTSTPELPQPVHLPTIKTELVVKQECEESDSDSESIYASSECSGEFLAQEPENEEQFKHCIVRIETDPVIELMCNEFRKEQKAFPCECGRSFKLEGYLLRHLKKCTKVRKKDIYKESKDKDSFVCVICHAQHTEKESLDRHFKNCMSRMKQRCKEKLFICNICSKRYTVRYTFMLHVKKCSEQGQDSLAIANKPKKLPYQCRYCSKRFRTPSALVIHNRLHTGERPFKCEVCGKDFNQGAAFNRHKVTHKFHGEKRFHICDYCGKHFAFKTDIIRHIMLIHMKVSLRSCPICGKGQSSNHMNRHMLTHFPEKAEKTFPCAICNKVFLERSNLSVHMRVHTGEKPYRCKFCSTKFSYLTSLTRHEASHIDKDGSFLCHVCKKYLESKKRLMNHVKFHIWKPGRPVKKNGVARLDCSVRLTRLPRKLGLKLKAKLK